MISAFQAWDFLHFTTKSSDSHALAEAGVGTLRAAVMARLVIREGWRRTMYKLGVVATSLKARQRAMIWQDEAAV